MENTHTTDWKLGYAEKALEQLRDILALPELQKREIAIAKNIINAALENIK